MTGLFNSGEVQDSEDLQRIIRLPRRTYDDAFLEEQVELFTNALARPGGTMRLFPVQAFALHDIALMKGALLPVGVGHGKTLVSLLAPRVVRAKRPLIVVPASLKEKTFDDMLDLGRHWYLPPFIRVESYEFLSRISGADFLAQYKPDFIFCDEAHRLKNSSAACTKRIRRYFKDNDTAEHHLSPEVASAFIERIQRYLEGRETDVEEHGGKHPCFIAASGTFTKRSLKDYAHLSSWALRHMSPLPLKHNTLMEWCSALDQSDSVKIFSFGALEQLTPPGHAPVIDQASARKAFQSRFVSTPGVVSTTEGALSTSIELDGEVLPTPIVMEPHFVNLREGWELPDGHIVIEGVSKWRHARELALGFYYKWDPWPPQWWMEPRSAWGSEMRRVLKDNRRHLDTDLQLRVALEDHPEWYPNAAKLYEKWGEVEKAFKPNTVAVFLSDHAIHRAHAWAKKHKGIVWVEHQAFGERFEDLTGIPCYGESGLDRKGRRIEHHPHGTPMAAQVSSNCTGRNLQIGWSKNLIVSPPPSGLTIEQLLGRTHRKGQLADTVYATWLFSCQEHISAFDKCQADAQYVLDSQGLAQKVLYADRAFGDVRDMPNTLGPAWK